jgi:membrane dipeptidase
MVPVFDGHNDAITREDHADLVDGREGGHLDLPKMQAGGIRGAIFAVFSPSEDEAPRRMRTGLRSRARTM